MTDSPVRPHGHGQHKENQEQQHEDSKTQQRLCNFCGESVALLYCRADSAKLCLSCDLQVHSTNQLFTKHTRSLLCDACDSSPASIFCSTHNSLLCQNCDWEWHNRCLSSHDRRPLEGFSGCPSVTELLAIVGFEDVGKKSLFGGDGLLGSEVFGSVPSVDAFSDLFVWDTPSIVTLDDLINSNDSGHNFQVMGVPPLPKNRNAACGLHKEEILCQLRELAKLEPNFGDGEEDTESLIGIQPLVPERNLQLSGFEQNAEQTLIPSYEASAFQCCSDTGDVANEGLPSSLGSFIELNCLVPDKDSEIGSSLHHNNGDREGQSQHQVMTETLQLFPKVAARELTSQERETAISRYKEKKKTRRYDKHIRYESRKVRAESRTRIKGRFAKMNQ